MPRSPEPMIFKVRRIEQDARGTWGIAEVWHGPICVFRCHTIELPWRNNESMVSCIPAGRYPMAFTMSNRFKRKLWEVKNVKGRAGIRIHAANKVSELRGCIALGMNRVDIDGDGVIDIGRSRGAMDLFHSAVGVGPLILEVEDLA